MTNTRDVEIAKLKAKLESLENLREDLGDETVDAKKREIEIKLQALVETDGGAFVADNVYTEGGDFVVRDQHKYNVRIEAGAYVGERPQARKRRLEIYRGVLAARTGDLPLHGFDPEASDATSARADLSLARVYVSLNTELSASEREIEEAMAAAREGRTVPFPPPQRRSAQRAVEAGETRPISALGSVDI